MNNFFCAEQSRQVQEDLIDSAGTAQIYVLIECPTPWTETAINSKAIPSETRTAAQQLIEEIRQKKFSLSPFGLMPLLIYNHKLKSNDFVRVIILQQQTGLKTGYIKQEFQVSNLIEVVPLIKDYLTGKLPSAVCVDSPFREVLVCTHGSYDKCCARYGNPFYRQALATVNDLALTNIRVWQSSHFGGHRFAPTAIDFPEGRYYGRLDSASFTSILTRTGDIQTLNKIYRGWGILPPTAQALERELLLIHGWDWFNYKVKCQLITSNAEQTDTQYQIIFEKPDGSSNDYRANILADESKAVYLKLACKQETESKVTQFTVKNLVKINPSFMSKG